MLTVDLISMLTVVVAMITNNDDDGDKDSVFDTRIVPMMTMPMKKHDDDDSEPFGQ